MNQSVSNKIEFIKKKQKISLELLETLLIDVYRLLD